MPCYGFMYRDIAEEIDYLQYDLKVSREEAKKIWQKKNRPPKARKAFKLMGLSFLFLFLVGCSMTIPSLFPDKPRNINYEKTYNKGCKEVLDKEGNPILVEGTLLTTCSQEFNLKKGTFEKPLGFWATVMGMLGRFTAFSIIIIVLLFIFFPATLVQFLARRKIQLQLAQYKKTLTQVVSGVDQANAVEKDPELKTALSTTMDTDSKKLVDDIKRSNG